MKMTKRLIAVVAMLTLVVGMFGNVASICSAKSVSTAYSVSPTKNGKVAIKNTNQNIKVTVTYSAYPDNTSNVAKVEIYKNAGFTGVPVTSTTFNKTQPHTSTFSLPAKTTYYAKITTLTGNSFTGVFTYTY